MKEKTSDSGAFRTVIGGQALMEGLLMRGPKKQAIVINTASGQVIKEEELHLTKERYPVCGWPFIRGVVNFADSMVCGMKALMYSAELVEDVTEEQEKESKLDKWLNEKLGSEKAQKAVIAFSGVVGVAFAVLLFFLLPSWISEIFKPLIPNLFLRNLVEGVIRIIIFLVYIWLATRVKDIHRVFEYHGAEHKTIHCYEKGLELTLENVRPQPRQHPRCGTSFLIVVMIVSILVFSLVSLGWAEDLNVIARTLLRIVLLPVVVAISYEINRWAGRHDNLLSKAMAAPGKALQRLTVFEPDDEMIETGIKALTLVIPEEKGSDAW